MQNCQRAFSGCANGSRLYPTKNDPVAHASGSSNPDLNVTPFDTLRRTLTERHYRLVRAFLSDAGIAQTVEQRVCNAKVRGSTPFSGTNRIEHLARPTR